MFFQTNKQTTTNLCTVFKESLGKSLHFDQLQQTTATMEHWVLPRSFLMLVFLVYRVLNYVYLVGGGGGGGGGEVNRSLHSFFKDSLEQS